MMCVKRGMVIGKTSLFFTTSSVSHHAAVDSCFCVDLFGPLLLLFFYPNPKINLKGKLLIFIIKNHQNEIIRNQNKKGLLGHVQYPRIFFMLWMWKWGKLLFTVYFDVFSPALTGFTITVYQTDISSPMWFFFRCVRLSTNPPSIVP